MNVPEEVALTYHDAFLLTPQLKEENLIPSQALSILSQLDELFERMSDEPLWTHQKLKTDKFWQRSRELAYAALIALNEPYDKPNLSFLNWTK